MRNIKLTVQYDGSKFHGWQKLNDLPSIQLEIERAVAKTVYQPVKVSGAEGTDKGVHARGQICGFIADTDISANQFLVGVNHFTSDLIVIVKSEEVDLDFHVRSSAKSRTYEYTSCNRYYTEPWFNDYKGHRKYYLDSDLLLKYREILTGKHDSTSFVNDLEEDINPARAIDEITIEKIDDNIVFTFKVESFLRNMVKILVGSVVDAARGGKSIDWLKNALENRDRQPTGITIEPYGLYLVDVEY